jgi:hypothetical protein
MKDTEMKQQLQLHPLDIICGRQKSSAEHLGNRRFQAMITLSFNRFYHTCWHNKKKSVKTLLVTNIMNNLMSEGARFVKRVPKTDNWLHVKNKRVIGDKICHALRDLFPRKIDIIRAKEFMKENGFKYNDGKVVVDLQNNDKGEDDVYCNNNDESHHSLTPQSCHGHMHQKSREKALPITSGKRNTLKYYMEQEQIQPIPLNLQYLWEVGIIHDTSKEIRIDLQDIELSGAQQGDNEFGSFMAKIDALPLLLESNDDYECNELKEQCKTMQICSNQSGSLLPPLNDW